MPSKSVDGGKTWKRISKKEFTKEFTKETTRFIKKSIMLHDLMSKLNLTEEQAQAVLDKFPIQVIEKALKSTVFKSKSLFKMNLLHYSKHND